MGTSEATVPASNREASLEDPSVMRSEAQRLSTFTSWRHNDKVEARKIAKAGFFHTGIDSEVKCLWCGTVLNEWEYGESVMARHRAANPDCPFIRNISDNVPMLNNEPQSQQNASHPAQQGSFVEESQDESGSDTPMEDQDLPESLMNHHDSTRPSLPRAELNLEQYKSEAARLETFRNWPHRTIRPADLANAGFVYTNDGDLVRCVFCGQYVGNWEEDDFPSTEHRNLFPECPFVRGFEVGNIPRSLDVPSPFNQDISPSRPDHQSSAMDVGGSAGASSADETGIRGRQAFSGPEKGPSNIRYVNGVPPTNEESIGIIRHSGPANTKYSTMEARLRTFKDWPPALKQEPRQLADAGFYYIGLSDQTKCFYCEGGLRNWQPDDDPWTEHARWFSKCGFVRLIKGDDFITKCLNERPPQTNFSTKDKPNGLMTDEEIKAFMSSGLVREVLALGIDEKKIQMALKQRGKTFNSANDLATVALSVQMDDTMRIIPNASSVESQANSTNENAQQPPRSESAPAASTSAQSSLVNPNSDSSKTSSVDLEQENQRLKDLRTCKICMDNEIGVVFLPCGHLICCVQCAPSLRDCPLCRQSIHGTVKTYMS
jgi:hypothetical protein